MTPRPAMSSVPSRSETGVRPVEVDIIILEWNRSDATIAAIQSALDQTGVRRKVWVVDQGSKPEHRARLAAFCEGRTDVHVHWLESNIGVAAGRNLASRLGSAPFIVSLDNDAVFADDACVARALAHLDGEPRLGALAFRVLDADTRDEDAYWDYPAEHLHTRLPWFEVTRFLGGGHALRREAFERAGGYDERLFFGGEERDVAWRMLKQSYRLRWYRDLAVLHRSTSQSKVAWSDQRYFFLVRNSLYINHKFGAGPVGFARGAASFTLRGVRNGLGSAALRGVLAGMTMSLRFSLNPREHGPYRLSRELRRYIAETDGKTRESSLDKLRRQLQPLPKV